MPLWAKKRHLWAYGDFQGREQYRPENKTQSLLYNLCVSSRCHSHTSSRVSRQYDLLTPSGERAP